MNTTKSSSLFSLRILGFPLAAPSKAQVDFYRCPNKPIIYYKGYEPGCGQRESGLEWARTYLPCITKSSMREKSCGVCEILLQLLECRYLAKNLSWAQWAPSPIDRLTAKAALSHQRSKRDMVKWAITIR